jgi:pyruvate kinase
LLTCKVTETEVHTVIQNDGILGQIKGVNLPGVIVKLPAITDKDKDDIAFGVANHVDFIAASFIRKASDVEEIRCKT